MFGYVIYSPSKDGYAGKGEKEGQPVATWQPLGPNTYRFPSEQLAEDFRKAVFGYSRDARAVQLGA
jgi:hypothetical protein